MLSDELAQAICERSTAGHVRSAENLTALVNVLGASISGAKRDLDPEDLRAAQKAHGSIQKFLKSFFKTIWPGKAPAKVIGSVASLPAKKSASGIRQYLASVEGLIDKMRGASKSLSGPADATLASVYGAEDELLQQGRRRGTRYTVP